MRKQLLTVLALAGMLLIGGHSSAWADTTIGLTNFDYSAKTVGAKTFTGMDHVTITKAYGSKMKDVNNDSKSRNVYFDANTAVDAKVGCWRKSDQKTYDNQWLGYTLTIEDGYVLNLSKIEAMTLVGKDEKHNWYVEILDKNNKQIYKSDEQTTSNSSIAKVSSTLSLEKLSGTIYVKLWDKQSGGTKYFVANLTVDASTAVDASTKYTVTTSVIPEGAGTTIPDGSGSYSEGEDAVLTAVANTGYKFVKWTVDGTDSENNPYTISSISTDHTAVATFKVLPVITFAKPEDVTCVNRAFPANLNTKDVGETYTLPYNYMYYKKGYTMTGWSDGTTTYDCGATYTVTTDATLTPVFTENKVSITDRKSRVSVKYDFARKTNNERYVNIESNADIFVTTATVDGETIDVKLDIDCQDGAGIDGVHGKVNNTSKDNCAQVNQGTVFTIPMVKGGVLKLVCTNANFTETTFNGTAVNSGAKTVSYTATEDGDVKVVIKEGSHYLSYIQVTYPVDEKITTTEGKLMKSLYLAEEVSIPSGVTAYTGALDETAGTVTLTAIEGGVIPAGEAVIVKADNAGDFTFSPSATGASKSDNNSLLGVTTQTNLTDLAKEGKTVLAFGLLDGVYGFRLPANTYIGANRAYLYVTTATNSEAKSISVVFDDDNTTGINTVKTAEAQNAPVFNLAGQRVSNATKGLLIKNGKKFINK